LTQAYNDWLADYCSHEPRRLGGAMLLPNSGVADALKEIERVGSRPGIVGALIGCYPHGDLDISPDDDEVWRALVEMQMPLHIHVSLNDSMPAAHAKGAIVGDVRFYDAPKRILQFVMTGVFDRFPELQLVMVEVDAGWVPYFKQQVMDRFERFGYAKTMPVERRPADYIEENVSFTIITDTHALDNRESIGIDRLLWSSDYPHMGADWPHSWRMINHDYARIPRHERELILTGNAQRLYRFDQR
jgi:predicted TIM-barrel fold metal-dependent hydrolase